MGFLKRVLGGGSDREPGPGWASPMSAEEADALVGLCAAELERRGLAHTARDGYFDVEVDGQQNQLGLSNLAQVCHAEPREAWPSVVAEHVGNILTALRDEAALDERARDLAAVRDLLKVRLFPGASLGGMEPRPPVSWEVAPALTAAFVYDLPTTVRSVGEEHLAAWGLDREALMPIALDNLRADAISCQPMVEGGPSAPIACVADHFFAAAHAFLLDERIPPGTEHGAVFAVPHRHALLYAPIVDLGIVESINRIILVATSLFQQGPGSISPGLYWWRAGSVTLLPANVDGTKVQFSPPDDFVAVLNGLAAPGS